MMKRSKKLISLALTAVFSVAALAGCDDSLVPDENGYSFTNPGRGYETPDAGITLDGKPDEEIWQKKHFGSASRPDTSGDAVLNVAAFAGEKGIYYAMDVDESLPVYVNPVREAYANTCVETYLALNNKSYPGMDGIFEMQLMPNGEYKVRQRTYFENWEPFFCVSAKATPQLKAQVKGEINTENSTGYTLEFFIPYLFFEELGYLEEGEKLEDFYTHYCLISMRDYTTIDYNLRVRADMGPKLKSGLNYDDRTTWLHYDQNGMVGNAVTVTSEGNGTVKGEFGQTFLSARGNGNFVVQPESGNVLAELKVNGVNAFDRIKASANGYVLSVTDNNAPLEIKAKFVQSAAEAELSGTAKGVKHGTEVVFPAGTKLTLKRLEDGSEHTLTLGANGAIQPQTMKTGVYTVTANNVENCLPTTLVFTGEAVDWKLSINYFRTYQGTNVDYSRVNSETPTILRGKQQAGFIVESTDSFRDLSLTTTVYRDWNDDGAQRMAGVMLNFSNGTGLTVVTWREPATGKLRLCIRPDHYGTTESGSSAIGGDFIGVVDPLTDTKYFDLWNSASGLTFTVVRKGRNLQIKAGDEVLKTLDLGAAYENLTCTFGFCGIWLKEDVPFVFSLDAAE